METKKQKVNWFK